LGGFAFCILLTAGTANAALIAEWQFNNYTGGAVSQAAEYGTQAASATAAAGTKYTFSQTTGTTLNEFASSSPNNALRMVTTRGNPGDALLTLQLSGVGLSGFVLTYASQDSANISQTWAWSINGTVFNAVASTVVSTTWNSYTLDFSGVTALNNATTVYFRNTVTTGRNGQSVDFDNISVAAVPEPTHVALGVFGVLFAGGAAGRRMIRRLQAA
jgi:hypothetical protein